MSFNLNNLNENANMYFMSGYRIPVIINNNNGTPFNFHTDVVPQVLNYLRNYPQIPGFVVNPSFGPNPPYYPIDFDAFNRMNYSRTLHYIGNFSHDPTLADFFKHLREISIQMQRNGDEAIHKLIPNKYPTNMIKLNESTSNKVGV